MEANSTCSSPKEDGELEDGEIFDDEPQKRQSQGARPPRRTRNNRPAMNKRARVPGHMMNNSAPVPMRGLIPTGPHPPFPAGLREGSGFWERSHGALGRFRYRGRRASDWTRDWTGRFPENHGSRSEKRILKPAQSTSVIPRCLYT